ncbi:MAG: HEAT repeat domain-containing protein, partial [Planctomycetes bacterium]|nr:HEAT repeat domain-containing protein [Planctomycetota bacterium]
GDDESVVATLRAWLEPLPAPEPEAAGSVLMRWLGRRAELRAAASAIAAMENSPADRARAQALAAKFLHVGAPSAILQAALGLPDADGVTLVAPEQAALRAHAIDPTFFVAPPAVFTGGTRPVADRGDLEDFAHLPAGERLATLCCGDTPLAVALRARFPSRCARVLLAAFARGPMPPAGVAALRELADPFVLAEAFRIAAARDARAEALAVWRGDLPLPAALPALCEADPALRPQVAAALGGRRDPGSLALLADFLESPSVEVRRAAASSLRATCGEAVPYDPDAPGSATKEAAERLRSLHNRKP